MKRKFKLFATVASLCLSVALMAFGVYAAAQVTYKVDGSVSYTVKNALVTVTTTAEYMVTEESGSTGVTQGNAGTNVTTEFVTGKFYKAADTSAVTGGEAWNSYESTGLLKEDPNGTASINVDFNTSTVWKITINVKTINESGVYVALDDETFGLAGTENYGVVEASDYHTAGTQVTKDDSGKDFVFYVFLKDVKINTTVEEAFSILLNIDQDQAEVIA